jgi:hypothetical protein
MIEDPMTPPAVELRRLTKTYARETASGSVSATAPGVTRTGAPAASSSA